MAELERRDLISDEAIEAPYKLADGVKSIVSALNEVRDASKKYGEAIQESNSTTEIKKYIEALEKQRAELEKNNKKAKEAREAADKHGEAIHALDAQTGGYIGNLKEMGKQFIALAKSPFILMLAGLVATFTALTSAAKTFYTAMADGEDELDRQRAVWDQFFTTLQRGWGNFGRSVTKNVGQDALKKILAGFLAFFSIPLAKEFEYLAEQGERLADRLNELNDTVNANRVKSAKTQTEVNELFLKAQDAVNYTEQQRLGFIDEYIRRKREQQTLDLEIAREQEKNLIIAIGLQRGLSETESNMLFERGEMSKEFLDEDKKRITDARVNTLNIEAKHTQELRRIYRMRNSLLSDAEKAKISDVREAGNKLLSEQQKIIDKEIAAVQESMINQEITREEGERRILFIQRAYADDIIRIEMNTLEKILALNILNADQRADVEKKLAQLKLDLNKAVIDQIHLDTIEVTDETLKQFEEWKAMMLKTASDVSNILGSIGDSILALSDQRIEALDAEQERLRANYERELMFVEDNVEARTKLENEFADRDEKLQAKRAHARRRAAEFEKKLNIAQAYINMAASIIEAAPNLALMIAMGVAGALQIGVIASQQIPQYELGTKDHKGGRALVGERGKEIVITPSGAVHVTPSRATIMDLPAHSMVLPHDQSMQFLATAGLPISSRGRLMGPAHDMGVYFRELNATIKNKKETQYNWTRKGLEIAFRNGETRNYFLNGMYR